MIKIKTIKPQNTQISQEVGSGTGENKISDTNLENSEISNTENNEDEYEEIIFHDDFDKEYRKDIENDYFDE